MNWRYYNHAMIPNTPPHVEIDTSVIKNGSIWEVGEGYKPLLSRWTSDFDCGYETSWWYCIKDTPFDIAALPSKKRYEINKGKKNFCVRVIDASAYVEDIIEIQEKAWMNYPKAYRPTFNADDIRKKIPEWNKYITFGAFDVESDKLYAYARLEEHADWVNFMVLKSDPSREKFAINAALVAGICEHYNSKLSKEFYICDGERNIVHQTAFQDYLIKYFCFRRAYCKLNIVYRPPLNVIVKLLYPFRKTIQEISKKSKLISTINAVLLMEEISRADR